MSISQSIKKDFFLYVFLSVFLLSSEFTGFFVLPLILYLFFLGSRSILSLLDKNGLVLLLFSITFQLFLSFNQKLSFLTALAVAVSPLTFYLIGKYASIKTNPDFIVFYLFLLTFLFSAIPIISILYSISKDGFAGSSRSIPLIWNENREISATGMGAFFTLNMAAFSLIFAKKQSTIQRNVYYLALLIGILSTICVLRLGSRTQLVIGVFSIIISYLFNLPKISLKKNILILVSSFCIILFLINKFNLNTDLFSYYLDRMDDKQYGVSSAGGRSEKWIASLNLLVKEPMGWSLKKVGFAHNLWLDVARASGIIPFAILILFSIMASKSFLRAYKNSSNAPFLKTYFLFSFFGFMLSFFVEPIMDANFIIFLMFCVFSGLCAGMQRQHINKISIY